MLEYTAPHIPPLNGIIERNISVIKEGALAMLLNIKFNYTAHKILWSAVVHTYECMQNSMAATGSTKSLFVIFYGEKYNIIGFVIRVWVYCIHHEKR